MKFVAIVHEAEEGGYWAEVPAVPGCVSQGETMEELIVNLREAISGCLSAPVPDDRRSEGLVLEIAV
jgi:predicted RNase H-like HicB family nuclease